MKMNKTVKSIVGWVVYILILIGLVYGIPRGLAYILKTDYPMASITSGSMWPALKQGDLVLIKGVERSTALVLESLVEDWPGLRMEKNAQRQYVFAPYFSHILGYTGQVDSSDLENYPNYSLNDQIGKAGLEYQYEDFLRGEPGQDQIEVDYLGKTQKLLASKSAQPGQGLLLFVDQELQEKLAEKDRLIDRFKHFIKFNVQEPEIVISRIIKGSMRS